MSLIASSLAPIARRRPTPPPADIRRLPNPRANFAWRGPFENYSRAWVAKHYWRVRYVIGSRDDALQECAVVFARVVNSYASKVDSDKWLMALYKTALLNAWNTFAEKDRRIRVTRDPDLLDAANMTCSPVAENDGPLAMALRGASAELRTVLHMIADAPTELLALMFPDAVEGDNVRLNRVLCRICKIPSGHDIVAELRTLLS